MHAQRNSPSKVTAFYKVFNEADFLKESIASIYEYADKIVVFEYCLDSMRKVIRQDRVTKDGLSTDGTTEIVKSFPDPENKIEHCPVGFIWGAESIPYQMIVDSIEVGDYAWVVDGDIVYPDAVAKRIRGLCDEGGSDVIWVPERVFFHDVYTEIWSWLTHHQRVFRKQSEVSFYFPTCFEVHWLEAWAGKDWRWYGREAICDWGGGEVYKTHTLDVDAGEVAHHYAVVRSHQRNLEKFLWQYEMIDKRWNSSARGVCRQFGRDALDFKLKTHHYFLNHEQESLRPYNGSHPEAMAGNKWMDYKWDWKSVNMSYAEALKLVGEPSLC